MFVQPQFQHSSIKKKVKIDVPPPPSTSHQSFYHSNVTCVKSNTQPTEEAHWTQANKQIMQIANNSPLSLLHPKFDTAHISVAQQDQKCPVI